jgi:hypothetical protein
MSSPINFKYGRIPAETVRLVEVCANTTRERISNALPPSASPEIIAFTVQAVLDTVLKDWLLNENTAGPDEDDWQDIASFVKLAVSLAQPDLNDRGLPVYQATLNGLLSDWLYNWNSDSEEASNLEPEKRKREHSGA